MANYNSLFTSNYFPVTDEAKFCDIVKHIRCYDDEITIDKVNHNGVDEFSFCAYGGIQGYAAIEGEPDYDEDDDGDWDKMVSELQTIIPNNVAMIITCAGNEKLRYVDYYTLVITNKNHTFISNREVTAYAVNVLFDTDEKGSVNAFEDYYNSHPSEN